MAKMMSDIAIKERWDENLRDRCFRIVARNRRNKNEIVEEYVFFPEHCFDHLLGINSNWHMEKAEALPRLCYPNNKCWNIFGYYNGMEMFLPRGYNGDVIILGGKNYCFACIYERDWDVFVPMSCRKQDADQMSISPYHVEEVIEEDPEWWD